MVSKFHHLNGLFDVMFQQISKFQRTSTARTFRHYQIQNYPSGSQGSDDGIFFDQSASIILRTCVLETKTINVHHHHDFKISCKNYNCIYIQTFQ